ncbi:acyltransferase [Paucibacter sp. O1-1]|nr:acyltransferase [Paucibacter sp. O1-1]MDA3830673.1 acyltransferase [Paucibacter sp. O1-1]
MNKPFSIYLDLVRFSAAVLVYFYHSNQRFLSTELLPASHFGHSSVIVFFVLSGFIISYITDTKENDWRVFMASRFSRVFSVVVPAILVTLLADGIGRQLYPAIYSGYPFDQFGLRLLASSLLMNETWLISVTFFSNVPYWSIGYEWWYYMAFACLHFLRGRSAWLAFAAIFALLGPKLVLLAPIWWLGVLLHRWRSLAQLSAPAALLGLLASIAGIVAFHWLDVEAACSAWLSDQLGAELHRNLTFSKFFLSDYLLGPLVFLNFACMRVLATRAGDFFQAIERPTRFLAQYTFTLYLLHQPLFLFWGAVVRGNPGTPAYWLSVTALTFATVGLIGHFTENKRGLLRDWALTLLRRGQAPQRHYT